MKAQENLVGGCLTQKPYLLMDIHEEVVGVEVTSVVMALQRIQGTIYAVTTQVY